MLQNKFISTEVKNVSSSYEFVFGANQLDFFFGGLFTVVSEVVVTILFFVGKKTQVCKLFVNLSKSFCNCNQLNRHK